MSAKKALLSSHNKTARTPLKKEIYITVNIYGVEIESRTRNYRWGVTQGS